MTVTPAALTVSITASDKVYDATTAATVSAVNPAAGLIAGDDVTATASNGNFDNKNVGTGKTVTADIATSGADAGNYSFNATAADLADITQAAVTVSITADDKVYDATTAATVAVSGISGILLSDVVTATASNGNFDNKNVGTGKTVTADIATSGADAGNYSFNATSSTTADIMPAPLTITAQNASKYEGQANPAFTVTYDGFVGDETESVLGGTLMFTTAATVNSCAGNYDIIPSGFTPGNYAFTYVNGTLTVLGTSIDASASSTPVPVGQPATLRATVTPNVPGVSVTFVLTNDANVTVFSQTVLTNASGVATATTGNLGVLGVYEVTATVGSGCASSIAYIPVFDASGSFVTGGGWINSPAGALVADPTIVGKANFGFVSKYKKGSTQVDGNTEFQFQAGSLNFKSTMHESGSLVISGGRATYRGTGTINGQSGFKFVVVAIDGQWNGQSNPDRFRIKISTTAGVVVYDNQMGSAENTADATILGNNGTGGGSIVIHEVKSNGKKRIAVDLQEVTWNTSNEDLVKALDQMSKEWFEGSSVAMRWNIDAYDGMKPGFYQVVGEVISGNLSDLEDMVEIPVLVREKPRATDILATVKVIPSNVEVGQVFTKLITVDKADDIHTYQVSENDYFELVDDQLVWKSAAIPAELRVTVTSTDRAGQTIERELVFRKGAGNNGNFDIPAASSVSEVIVHPNPAREQFANVQVRLSQAAKVNLRVYDPQGRLVYQDEAYEENSFMRTLDLKGYSNGLYMILVQVDNQLITKRLIKE
ncbi:hemagglutination activity domain family [Mariniradius saccharolyticus AK6]|uniref:Hemagglutination activity domain family n=1 Tax=Mariniradius saccharolyticus AK6 TaxID=1239962 RepID=M7XQU5_9BACT|nr:hemagglutination activity domain family [Mariniradius saccharolyticus AK6]